jgi:hypothetical protein
LVSTNGPSVTAKPPEPSLWIVVAVAGRLQRLPAAQLLPRVHRELVVGLHALLDDRRVTVAPALLVLVDEHHVLPHGVSSCSRIRWSDLDAPPDERPAPGSTAVQNFLPSDRRAARQPANRRWTP